MVDVALFELDPNPGADLRDGPEAHLLAGHRERPDRPARGRQAEHVRDLDQQPPGLHRIDVVEDHAPVLAEVLPSRAHAGTRGVIEIRPFRVSENFCLNSPFLSVLVTLFTKYSPSKAVPAPRTPTRRLALSRRP